jgi:phenylacetate-CoA ligase
MLDDVAALPFTQKTDLRDHYPYGLFARPVDQLARLHASSGTTGKSTVVGYTRQDLEHWADLMARSMYGAGRAPGDIVHNAYGYGLFTGGLGAHYGAERLGAVVVPVSGGGTERQVGLIQDFGARCCAPRPPMRWRSPRRRSSRAWTCARASCASACSAPSRGAPRCARRSRSGWA